MLEKLVGEKFESLKDFYVFELQDLYSAEGQIIEALPKMVEKARSPVLRDAFRSHLEETKKQLERLEAIFKELGVTPKAHDCKAMKGIIKEGEEIINAYGDQDTIDAALITAGNRVEHYEIAAYGCARTHARQLGFDSQADLLQETLDEEGEADKRLTAIAEEETNKRAAAIGE